MSDNLTDDLTPEITSTDQLRYSLLGSFLEFTRYFYKIRTGRKFEVPQPVGRESHYITLSKALTKVFNGEIKRLLINIPPRYGKTELMIHFIAWALAHSSDCNFLYTSYSATVATKQTATVKQIITHPEYRRLFPHVKISGDTQAKGNFETTAHGSVYAAGEAGSITSRGAGIAHCQGRFSGCIVIDDILKPDEASSDTIRDSRNNWYKNTLLSRKNSEATPIIIIAQRIHEADLPGVLLEGFDGQEWEKVVLRALDEHDHTLLPTMHSVEYLKNLEQTSPYVYWSQYQQQPQPAGGGIFREDWFVQTPEIPDNIIATFLTVDTAETEQTYNCATVFSFWGVYQIFQEGIKTPVYGLHWIDCSQMWCEPKDLHANFLAFWDVCCNFKLPPKICFIEKKSTGSTLLSVLKTMYGLSAVEIERLNANTCKTQRFLNAQPYVASKLVSITRDAKHTEMCIKHMGKITANRTHRYDDIADTCADAVMIALKDKRFTYEDKPKTNNLSNFHLGKKTIYGG